MPSMRVLILVVVGSVCLINASFGVGPITFSAADYDNTANTVIAGPTTVYNQGTGTFRDIFWWRINNGQPAVGSGDYIFQGQNLVPSGIESTNNGAYTALNFKGPAVSGGQSYVTIYDTTPADGATTKDVFNASGQPLILSADVLFAENHASRAGVLALYNEGQDGLALVLSNGGGNNPDVPRLSLVWQSSGQGTVLSSTNLTGSSVVLTNWYRVKLELSVTGDTFTANGTFQTHTVGSNPNSALGGVFASLSFSGSLTNALPFPLSNPGEVGLIAQGAESISLPNSIGVSITNFEIVPEPSTMAMALLALIGCGLVYRKRR